MEDVVNQILGPVEAESDPFETVAGELQQAMESKDSKLMAKALKAFIAMQGAEPEQDE